MRAVLVALMSLSLSGCLEIRMKHEDLLGSKILFTPDVPVGGIDQWSYEFRENNVFGCNHEAAYESDSWILDQAENSVQVMFGVEWEKYYLHPHSKDLFSGDFEYDSSPGVQMQGSWLRNSGLEPAYCP